MLVSSEPSAVELSAAAGDARPRARRDTSAVRRLALGAELVDAGIEFLVGHLLASMGSEVEFLLGLAVAAVREGDCRERARGGRGLLGEHDFDEGFDCLGGMGAGQLSDGGVAARAAAGVARATPRKWPAGSSIHAVPLLFRVRSVLAYARWRSKATVHEAVKAQRPEEGLAVRRARCGSMFGRGSQPWGRRTVYHPSLRGIEGRPFIEPTERFHGRVEWTRGFWFTLGAGGS